MWDVGAVKVCLEASSRLRVCARVRRVLRFLVTIESRRRGPPTLLFSLPRRQLHTVFFLPSTLNACGKYQTMYRTREF